MSRRQHSERRQIISNACCCEPLEGRRMLAVFPGTNGNDVIDIFNFAGGGMNVRVNNVDNITTDTSITINAGLGNDTFNVSSSRTGTTILARGEGGDDTLTNPSVEDLDAVYHENFTFDGGTGTDTVTASNTEDATTPYEMELQGSRIFRNSNFLSLLEYDNIESLRYFDNDGSNLIGFYDMQTVSHNVKLSIFGNGGNDTIFNSSDVTSDFGDWNESIGTGPGAAVINGGAGTDTLHLRNSLSDTNVYDFNEFRISGSAFPGSGTGLLDYSSFETIDFVGGAHNESVIVSAKPSATTLHINSGGGTDTFTVGGDDLDDSGILFSNTALIGGAGTDSVTVEDAADTGTGVGETYSWNSTTFIKGSAGFTYSEFENQTLVAANGPGVNTLPLVNLIATASAMSSTTVIGGSSRQCRVDVGGGNINNINGTLLLNLSGGPDDAVNVNNGNDASTTVYQLNQGSLSAPEQINYSGVKTFTINGGPGSEHFFINGVSSGMAVILNAANGHDNFTLGSGNVDATVLGPVTFNGGAGTNLATVNNISDASLEMQTLNGTTFIDGFSHNFSSLTKLTINEGPGGTNLIINATAHQTDVNGGSGNDTFTVGGGDIDANIPAGTSTAPALLIDGNGGNDSIRFNDFNDAVANNDSYTFQQTNGIDQLRRFDASDVFISWMDIEGVTLDQSNAPQVGNLNSFTTVNEINTPLRINGNGGLDQFQVNDAATPVFLHTGLGDRDNLFINNDGDAILATVVIEQDDDIENLTIAAGGTLRITSNAVVAKTRLGLNPSVDIDGVLDLAGGALLSRAGGPTPADFRTKLIAGRNGGSWNGTSPSGVISSSLANSTPFRDSVGYGLGSEIAPISIGPFSIASGDTLLCYALDGDANLDGLVNLADFNRLAANFGLPNRAWVHADFNYDAAVNLADFNPLAGNFGQAAASSIGQQPGRALRGADDDLSTRLIEELL